MRETERRKQKGGMEKGEGRERHRERETHTHTHTHTHTKPENNNNNMPRACLHVASIEAQHIHQDDRSRKPNGLDYHRRSFAIT